MPNEIQLADLLAAPGSITKKPSKRDRDFFLMSRRGWSPEDIAVRNNTSVPVVKAALDRYALYRDSLANEEIDLDLNAMAARLIPKAEKVLTGAMGATVSKTFTKGKKTFTRAVPDHGTRLKAIETMRSMVEAARPKGGGIQINTQVNNGKNGEPARVVKFDFESRVRMARESKGLANDDAPITAEYEDEMTQNIDESEEEFGDDEDDEEDEDEDDE